MRCGVLNYGQLSPEDNPDGGLYHRVCDGNKFRDSPVDGPCRGALGGFFRLYDVGRRERHPFSHVASREF
jgi:hypothetical protein